MRVPRPGLLQLNRENLLRDVRDRLAERYPDYADESDYDATDPAWVILEQSAWLVELLSQQLDLYPYSIVQEFVSMMGGKLHPAIPSLGVMIAQPAEAGNIELQSHRPSPWRFFTLQSEEMDLVEFAPVEPKLHLRPSKILNISRVEDGELYLLGKPKGDEGIQAMEAWRTYNKRSRIFDEEWIRYDIITSNAEDLMQTLDSAIEALETRNLGWLEFRTEQPSPERVSVFARVNLGKAFQADAPTGLTDGSDLMGRWGTLDDSVWTPPVRISADARIPRRLQGEKPMPGLRRGTILIPALPENLSVENVLERKSQPLPTNIVEAIWLTLTHMDQKLAPLKPSINRGVAVVDNEEEPTWIGDALDKGMWTELSDRAEQEFIHIQVDQFEKQGGAFRTAFVLKGIREESIPDIRVFGIDDNGFQRVPLRYRISWKLRMPDPSGGQRMVLVIALDIDLDEAHNEILIATECSPVCTMVNAVMVANAPCVFDGRELTINRNVPEPINLLFDDVVNKDVVKHLLRDNIPADTARILSRLSVSYLEVTGAAAIEDFDGVWIDPTSTAGDGAMIRINAPDDNGYQRYVRPGKTVTLNWYRRTDGAYGNVAPSAIQVVEQPPRVTPLILACHNPLATFYGADRESEREAIERMFSPSSGVPVMPSDWERLFRVAFGVKGRGWVVRCWGHAERNLMATRLWPMDESGLGVDRDQIRLKRSIDNAGPDTLLVVIGNQDKLIEDADLDWARGVILGLVRKQMDRIPIIKDVIVTKFYPLTLHCSEADSDIPLPNFTIDDMKGTVTDTEGNSATLTTGRLLLNGGVVTTEVTNHV